MKLKTVLLTLCSAMLLFTAPLAAEQSDLTTSDTWLEAKLTTTYLLNRHLSLFDIDGNVEKQVAYLTGTVDSPVKKDLAEEIARSIEGIKDVENSITVAKEIKPREAQTDRSFNEVIDDLSTTAAIKSKLLANPNVSGLSVNVTTNRGSVTLEGNVESSESKALIEQIAKNTGGVESVTNKLEIKS